MQEKTLQVKINITMMAQNEEPADCIEQEMEEKLLDIYNKIISMQQDDILGDGGKMPNYDNDTMVPYTLNFESSAYFPMGYEEDDEYDMDDDEY